MTNFDADFVIRALSFSNRFNCPKNSITTINSELNLIETELSKNNNDMQFYSNMKQKLKMHLTS